MIGAVLFCLTERESRATVGRDLPSRMALTSRPSGGPGGLLLPNGTRCASDGAEGLPVPLTATMRALWASGLIALLDDVAALAKVAARFSRRYSRPGSKGRGEGSGIVIDDAAVTPRYVVGFGGEARELPIVGKIEKGRSGTNCWFLLPVALALNSSLRVPSRRCS